MAKLRNARVEFDKNKKSGRVYVSFFPELLEPEYRTVLLAMVKEEAGLVLVRDGFSWSNLFKVVGVPTYHIGHTWLDLELDLLRVNKPPEWSDELYEACIAYQVRLLCHFIMDHVDFIEEDLLHEKLPEVSRTLWFDED